MRRARILCVLLNVIASGCVALPNAPQKSPTLARFEGPRNAPAVSERYYLLVFASQSIPKLPRYTHTWATAVCLRNHGLNQPPQLDVHTISWLPDCLRIHTWDLRVDRGVNLDLGRTMQQISSQGQRISLWGPYEIDPDLYCHFLAQQAFLQSGQVGYQAIDDLGEAALCGNGMNCVHAIADSDDRFGDPAWLCGAETGEFLVRHLEAEGALIHSERVHDWLLPQLGLIDFPIVRRNSL
jgi:hypothetical protein